MPSAQEKAHLEGQLKHYEKGVAKRDQYLLIFIGAGLGGIFILDI